MKPDGYAVVIYSENPEYYFFLGAYLSNEQAQTVAQQHIPRLGNETVKVMPFDFLD